MKKNKISKITTVLLLIAALTAWFGCGKKSTQPDTGQYPDSNLSFSQHIQPIFTQDCAYSGCHIGSNAPKGLNLSITSTNIYNSSERVVIFPNDGENSPLYKVLIGTDPIAPPMPYQRSQLSNEKIKAIKTWIDEGASVVN